MSPFTNRYLCTFLAQVFMGYRAWGDMYCRMWSSFMWLGTSPGTTWSDMEMSLEWRGRLQGRWDEVFLCWQPRAAVSSRLQRGEALWAQHTGSQETPSPERAVTEHRLHQWNPRKKQSPNKRNDQQWSDLKSNIIHVSLGTWDATENVFSFPHTAVDSSGTAMWNSPNLTETQHYWSWKRPPTTHLTMPCPPLNHIPSSPSSHLLNASRDGDLMPLLSTMITLLPEGEFISGKDRK